MTALPEYVACCSINENLNKERLSCGMNASFLNEEGRFDNLRIYGGAAEMGNKTVCVVGRIQIGQIRGNQTVHLEQSMKSFVSLILMILNRLMIIMVIYLGMRSLKQ